MRIIRDYITNWRLNIKNSFAFVFSVPGKHIINIESDVNKTLIDKFNNIDNWIKGHPRGDKHTNTDQVYLDANVHLNTQFLTISGDADDPRPESRSVSLYNHDSSFGCIYSKDYYSYGVYKFTFDLPRGKFRTPIISLLNIDTYPPEIQVMKGYSNRNEDYTSLDTDFKLGNNSMNIKSVGFKEHRYIDERKTQSATLHWTNDFIKIYYNGYLVREMTQKSVLKELNFNPKMQIVISNENIFGKKHGRFYRSDAFKIHQFEYYPI